MRISTYAAALAFAVSAVVPAAAQPEPLPAGGGCGWTGAQDPAAPGRWSGVVRSGPVVMGEPPYTVPDPASYPVGVTVECTVKIYPEGGPSETVTVVSPSGIAVAAVPPTPVSFDGGSRVEVEVCTTVRATDAQGREYTYYQNYQNGMYTTDPDVACGGPTCESVGPECSYLAAVEQWLVEGWVDPPVCAAFTALPPGVEDVVTVDDEGDVSVAGELLWDCPPYGSG